MNACRSLQPPPSDEIAALARELEGLRQKRRGIENAITQREQKLNRLKSQRVLAASPETPFAPQACFA